MEWPDCCACSLILLIWPTIGFILSWMMPPPVPEDRPGGGMY